MEKFTYTVGNQKKIERFLMIIYSIYSIGMMIVLGRLEEGGWINFFLLLEVMLGWLVHISQYRTHSFRAKFTAVMMELSIFTYAVYAQDLIKVLPVFVAFVILLCLYGMQEIIGITVVPLMLIFGYHCLIVNPIYKCSFWEMLKILLHLGNILLIEYIMYIWTKRNNEGSSQLLGAIEELKAAESSKNDFLANVSHEIRTPINSICGMSEIILREELPDKIRESILDIQVSGRNLTAVVSDILDFSELYSGKIELEEEAYNITSTINDVINMTMARKSEKAIELVVDCDASLPSALLGDEKKLRRIIMNLVDNAIKFTEEGCVSIIIGFRKEAYGINLLVTIKDTGIGMDEESLEKLFVGFSQVDASRRRHEGGVGLGLAISNALVQKLGGAITVKSKLGKGSSIKCVIPQKVLDETPIVSIRNKERINVAIYVDMEQIDMVSIRDEYAQIILHMTEQLKVKSHVCRNFAELQRRAQKEAFSHVFINISGYRQAQTYFDKLAEQTRVVVILDREDEKYVTSPHILRVYKPFYILTVVSVLNEMYDLENGKRIAFAEKFVTKDAHVLVVDDNRTNLRVVQGLLSHYKIQVTTALSGREALEKITSMNYDFVFMDHMMPEMDGVETMNKIRLKVGTYYQRVPIIALTANAAAGTREKLMAEGFDDFMEKPIERSVLERVLRRNLPSEKIISMEAYQAMVEAGEIQEVTEKRKSAETQEKNPTESRNSRDESNDELKIEGIDIQKGILYCNGREQYLKVLQGYCEDCNDVGKIADELFEKQDWKNYTITVHGMKSAMHSIGAIEVSTLAKALELAGKEGRIDYIKEHHAKLMEEYQSLFRRLRDNKVLFPQGMAEAETDKMSDENDGEKDKAVLPELADEVFDGMIAEMEDAMYDLDGEKLLAIMAEMEKYQYHQTAMSELMDSVKRKVEMSDYISAVELVVRWKNKVAGKER